MTKIIYHFAGKRAYLLSAALSVFFYLTFACQPAINKTPNIIVIFTDDQGYADVGSYGAEGFSTPNLDRMASEGMRFTDFYVASSVCSPSRAALLTGCYPQRVGIPDVLAPPGPAWTEGRTNIGLNEKETTIAEMLKKQGYATACIGKWHLGHRAPFLPTHHGFDEYFGLPYSNDMIPKAYPPLPLLEGEKVLEYNPDQSQLTSRYTQRAVDFIEKNKDHPFFLYLAHSMPHVPIHASKKYRGKSEKGLYGDVIMELDASVGTILDKLKELDIDNNTLLIFTSDNGPWLEYGNHAGSAFPLRDGKMTTFEGGQRVPCIMRWPGEIPQGKVSREIASTLDFLPTFAAISGASLPQSTIDGKNILSLIKDLPDALVRQEAFYYYNSDSLQAVRLGKWKLHLPHSYRATVEIKNNGRQGRVETRTIELSLYDLETDISEEKNVAAEHPHIVEKLMQLAKTFDAELKRNARPAGVDL